MGLHTMQNRHLDRVFCSNNSVGKKESVKIVDVHPVISPDVTKSELDISECENSWNEQAKVILRRQ